MAKDVVTPPAAHWLVALRMSTPQEVLAVTYEGLVSEPREQAERVLRHVGQEPDAALDAALDRPSRLSRADSAVRTGADRVSAWTAKVDTDDRARSGEVLEQLGLGGVYSVDDPSPDLASFGALHTAVYRR